MKVPTVLIVCFLLALFSKLGQCCGPAEIGQQYTITSTFDVPTGGNVTWEIDNGTVVYPLENSEATSQNYRVNETHLTILNVSKDDERWFYLYVKDKGQDVRNYTCELAVYKKASTPTCNNLKLIGTNITATCTTAEVYPQAKCQFTLQNEGTDRRDISDGTSYITYNHTDRNEYNSTSCTLLYPVDGFKPGRWTVQVNMYPDLTGVSSDQGTTGQAANNIRLSVPTVNIDNVTCPKGLDGEGDKNVRDGYIRQGGRASCLCTRAHAGNPPGTIGWSSTQGGNFANLLQSDDDAGAKIQINAPELKDTFTCQTISVLNGFHSITFTPKYAYGPSSVSLNFQPPGPIYLCPNQQTNINITCQVPANSFNPALRFIIRDNNNLVTHTANGTAKNNFIVKHNFTKSGQHTFTCRVENEMFRDIFAEAPARAIQVCAPPNSPPSIEVKGSHVKTDDSGTWVKRGSDISVECSVGAAYPTVNSVNVTCGQNSSSNGQLYMSGVSGDKLACQCSVDHVTKTLCIGHNLNKEMTIQSAYGPNEIKIYFANDQQQELPINESINLCGSEDRLITVICEVKGSDVRPGLSKDNFSLTKSYGLSFAGHRSPVFSEKFKYVNKLNVTTSGSHKLTCEAKNPKFSDIKQTQSVTVEVREPPSDPPMMSAQSNENNDTLVEGDDVTVTCNVSGGYPSVQSVTLTCGQDQSVTSNETTVEMTLNNIGLSYNETNCTCQATHVTGCYDLMGVLPLSVIKSTSTQSEMDDVLLIGAAVGGAVGAFVVIAVVVGVIICFRRGRKRKEKHSGDTMVHTDNSDLYFASRSFDPMNAPDTVFVDNSELYESAKKGYNPNKDPTAGDDPHQDKMSTFKDNPESYGTGSQGYDPHQDPTAVFRDNSELYGAASQGYNRQQNPTAKFEDDSELYSNVCKGYNRQQDPKAEFKDDSELYTNVSKGYNPEQDPTAEFEDDSELYSNVCKEPPLYSTVEDDDPQPTMASATTRLKKRNPELGINPYDNIDFDELEKKQKLLASFQPKPNKPKGPNPKPKPKPKIKPKPKPPKNDTEDHVTTRAPGGPPLQSANVYEEVEVKDPIYSLASNPGLSEDVANKGQGGPPQSPANDYDEVNLSDQPGWTEI